jgi:GNAT superfamily N-acetyltransferase
MTAGSMTRTLTRTLVPAAPLSTGRVPAAPMLADPMLAAPMLAGPMLAGPMLADPMLAAPVRAGRGIGVIRSGGPEDADSIRAFVCGLSPRSQYFRFFASVAPPSTGLLRALSGATGSADILVLTDSCNAVIGHAMAADAVGPDGRLETNIGLVVGDQWQGRGLGTALLDMLVRRAARRGVRALVLDVLPANDRMRGIIARRWPDAPVERTRDALVIRPPIRPADTGYPVTLPTVIGMRRDRSDRNAAAAGGTRAPAA